MNSIAEKSTGSQTLKSASSQIIIVGGGLAGMAAAIGLAKTGLKIIHLAPKAPIDTRTSALMAPSVEILQQLELVDNPDSIGEPLTKIRLIDATKRLIRAPEALFDSAEIGEKPFGWNFANTALLEKFSTLIKQRKNLRQLPLSATGMRRDGDNWLVQLSDGSTISAPLIVGADGKGSTVRQWADISIKRHQHPQSALVCDLMLERALDGESVEYHYENGPFTLVPAEGNKANLVWVDEAEKLSNISRLSGTEIEEILLKKSQNLFGRLTLKTKTFVFALSSHRACTMGHNGVVLVGESGHAFPPVGAQGLNLSLRDVADLLFCINETARANTAKKLPDDWAQTIADSYAQKRSSDIFRTNYMVDTLFKTLLSDFLPTQMARASGMWALKALAPLRKQAFHLGMGQR